MSIIALMTDFGTRDHYVAAMKGVILQINPRATLVDITHQVEPQNLLHGAFVLRQALPYFPPETIFVAVVDPGVGTRRAILAGRYSQRVVIAPDNGLLTLVHRDAELQELRVVENRRYFASQLSSTFHGRDILAPVAAHLSKGLTLESLGPIAYRMEVLDVPKCVHHSDGTVQGQVLLTDHFGNLITNICAADISVAGSIRRGPLQVWVGQRAIGRLHTTYSDVPVGEPVALLGSTQMLEIAVNNGNAAAVLECSIGEAVQVI